MKKLIFIVFFFSNVAYAQQYDIVLKNGHIIDPKNKIDAISDIAVKDGKIVTMVERHEIEGHEPMQVIVKLQSYFEENCKEV